MPKVWSETIESHRRLVRDAILDTAGELAAQHGMLCVTMSQIAEGAGIGRATLYKYFPDVETILAAWHHRQVAQNLELLADVRDRAHGPCERLRAVLEAFAMIHYEHHDAEFAAVAHKDEHIVDGSHELVSFFRELLAEGSAAGHLRDDLSPDELARYSFHAITAATSLPSKAAVRRLVDLIISGLRPQRP